MNEKKEEKIITIPMLIEEIMYYLKFVKKKEFDDFMDFRRDDIIIDIMDLMKNIPYEYTKKLGEFIHNASRLEELLEELNNVLAERRNKGLVTGRPNKTYVGFSNSPILKPIAGINANDLNMFVRVSGLVVSQKSKLLSLKKLVVECRVCGSTFVPTDFDPTQTKVKNKMYCPTCNRMRPVIFRDDLSEFSDYQVLEIQELPENMRAGEIPPRKTVILHDTLIGKVKPGDIVYVDGIVKQRKMNSSKSAEELFEPYLDALNIEPTYIEDNKLSLTKSDIAKIRKLAKDPELIDKIKASIAPHILGMDDVKLAVILSLIGGMTRGQQRGVIHLLLVGDPSTGKTQLMVWVKNELFPQAIFTTGQTASGVGLTAAVVKDNAGYSLSIGPVVQAHDGVCIIDEFDKISREDQRMLNDSMERGSIRIDKAGIHVELLARATIIAIANPKSERWDPYRTPAENIAMPPTVLSRFGLIFIVRDKPDVNMDYQLSKRIMEARVRDINKSVPIPLELLRKYILYARDFQTELSEDVMDKLARFYADMRNRGKDNFDVIPIAPRQLADLCRLTEAFAKLRLHKKTTLQDAEDAIQLFMKFLEQVGYDPQTQQFDVDRLLIGTTQSMRELINTAISVFEEYKETGLSEEEFLKKFEEYAPRQKAREVFNILKQKNRIYFSRDGKYFPVA